MDRIADIDLSKNQLDWFVQPLGIQGSVAADERGLAELVAQLSALPDVRVVLEATGGFEKPVGAALAHAGIPCSIVNPRQVRDFARALGQLAKTDRVDAKVLALFDERVRPEPRPWALAER